MIHMIEKGECPREVLRRRFAIGQTCDVCGRTEPLCRVVYEMNVPSQCGGGRRIPPECPDGGRDMDAPYWRYAFDPCPHDSPEACPWWDERREYRRQRLASWLESVGFPRSNRYPEAELLPSDIAAEVLRYVREYGERKMKTNVVIAGPVGAGKTSACAYLMAELDGGYARLVPAADLFDGLQHSIDEELLTIDILVVDDLGTEIATPVALQRWHRIVDRRYDEGLATIVTTNVDDVASLFHDERTRSRFMARCEVWRTGRGDVRPWVEAEAERARREEAADTTE